MYFDFEDYRPDIEPVGHAISWRDEVFLSIVIHAAVLALLIFAPRWLPAPTVPKQSPFQLQMQDRPRFVFVQPRLDLTAPKPPVRAEESDKNRMARTVEKAPNPTNSLPFSRGNTRDKVEAQRIEKARGQQVPPQQPAGQMAQQQQQQPQPAPPQAQSAMNTAVPHLSESPDALPVPAQPRSAGSNGRGMLSGNLGDAIKNLQRYVQQYNYDNQGGGTGEFGPAIQFDTKGVEFGPWIRRFIAQIKRNWFIPYAAMSMKGHVVITFNVHKDGSITDLTVVGPCPVEAFNNSAFGALVSSNPTQPLPPEYPSDKAFFTVTFFYNETPQ